MYQDWYRSKVAPSLDITCHFTLWIGRYGMWIYPIGDSYSADQECQDWYRRNGPLKEERLPGFQRLPQCPCTWWWLWGNWRWAYWRDGYDVMCFRMTVGRSRQLAPYGKVGGHCVEASTPWKGRWTLCCNKDHSEKRALAI